MTTTMLKNWSFYKRVLKYFKEVFGFKSLTNRPPCYVWDIQVEQKMLKGGIRAFKGSLLQNIFTTGISFKKKTVL
jgi:hypothetical protein